MLTLADAVGKPPGGTFLSIGLCHLLPLWLINCVVEADIDKGLLVKELLLEVTDHLFTKRLDAEACVGLD